MILFENKEQYVEYPLKDLIRLVPLNGLISDPL